MKIGVRIKLAGILSLVLFFATVTIAAMLIAHQKVSLETLMRSMAETITDEFAADSKMPLLQKDGLAINVLVENMLGYPGIEDVYILDDKLLIQGHSHLTEVGKEFFKYRDAILKARGSPPWLIKEKEGILTLASPIRFKDTTVGYVVLSFSRAFIKERVRGAVTSTLLITAAAIAAVSLLSIPVASGLLRPVFRLVRGTREVAVGNLDYRIPEGGNDEIGDLVRSFNNMASELKKKEILSGLFNRYVSPQVAGEILKAPETVRLGGEKREVTVFFADIRGFTSLSSRLEPELVVELLNRYFTLLTEIIFRFNGTVDKFIGDAVMGVFGAPVEMDTHLEMGIKTVSAIKMAVDMVNSRRISTGQVPLDIGMGLDTGEVIVGNMGSQMRMEYTAIGGAVNMASRLASIAAGSEILVTAKVYDLIKDTVRAEKISGAVIKGMDANPAIYRIKELRGEWKIESEGVAQEVIDALEGSGII